MGFGYKKLKDWDNLIACFEKISFINARKLYIEIQNETNENKKIEKREKLINGTLYVVLEFLKTSCVHYLNSCVYDMDDIISSCSEIWISKLDSGKLLVIKSFSQIFDYNFYTELSNKLISFNYSISVNTVLDVDSFAEILYMFIECKNNETEFNYNRFIRLLQNRPKYSKLISKMRYDGLSLKVTYELLDGIYKSLKINNTKNFKLSKTKIDFLKYILINNGLEFIRIKMEKVAHEEINRIINKLYYQRVTDIIFNSNLLDEKEKRILKKRFGIDNNYDHTYEELAAEENLTRERIRQIEAKGLRKIRHNKEFRKNI